MHSQDYEHLGALYLGRPLGDGALTPGTPLLLPSKHLVTHGVIVGMTGSGKTGLGAVLLEELAIDGVPAIVIDPKGDLGNLLLTFPSLDAASFAPWTPPGEDPAAVAARHARGLAEWGQDGARVARFAGAVERVLYTPGSTLARPLSLMPSLGAPPPGVDPEVVRERALGAATGLLTLVGIDPDPVKSPEHSLLATLLLDAWGRGQGHDLVSLLRAIQRPPIAHLGAMDLESVVPSKARASLAVSLNNAFASPAMAGFLAGEPLEVERLFYTVQGRPKLSILSLAHLCDADRMFFVTVLLGEILAWMRAQSGTSSLRALLYMDEVFGFFPPVASPPAKRPMLTLLKQARAFGLGVVLATQNPVDLDYKGLANTGTWMLGRLQTERDKLRVLDGLEGAAAASGQALDRARMDTMLSGLAPRTFLLHSVHERAPRPFQSRWALSYLRGPLSRDEMRRLATPADARPSIPASSLGGAPPAPSVVGGALTGSRPVLPPEIRERFYVSPERTTVREYRPGVLCRASLRFVDVRLGLDTFVTPTLLAPLGEDGPRWAEAWFLGTGEVPLADAPREGVAFAALPAAAARPASYKAWEKGALAHFARDRPLVVLVAPALGLASRPGETRDAFLGRVAHAVHEGRDAELEKLARTWQPKIDRAREKVENARRKLEAARADGSTAMLTSGLEIGATVLGAVLGRRRSVTAGATRVARSARTAARRSATRERAEADLATARAQLATLEADVEAALAAIRSSWRPENVEVVDKPVLAKRSEITLERLELTWVGV
jgi:hypothetical protein